MSTPTLTLLLIAVAAVFALPRRWVPVPFLVLACYVSRSQTLEFGPFGFTVLRALTIVTLLRVLIYRDWRGLSSGAIDLLMYVWAFLLLVTVAFHDNPGLLVVGRLGIALDGLGLFLVFRLFCRSRQDITFLCGALAVVLVPLAGAMLYEKVTSYNVLAIFGAPEAAAVRDGRVRAVGPFGHSILAGTVGALSIPLVAAVWATRQRIATAGLLACITIVVTSTSSGPLLSLVAAIFAMALWPLRGHVRPFMWCGVGAYGALALVMNRPAYYVISMIDFTGSSTGWHRARLIESALIHIDEWWLVGTDYTRHWMATGVGWNPDHTDLTNYYIHLGVYGGLPLLVSFLAVAAVSFSAVGSALRADERIQRHDLLPWALGSSLFTVVVTGISISFFDQSLLWLCMTIAGCGALTCTGMVEAERVESSLHRLTAHRARRRAFRRAAGKSRLIRNLA